MPTYQYRCRDCGEDLEVVQSFTDDALTECPACGGSLRKVFNAPGISFKGSGFYKNDSRGSAKSTVNGSSSEKSEKSEKSETSSSSSETKKSDSSSGAKSGSTSDAKAKQGPERPSRAGGKEPAKP